MPIYQASLEPLDPLLFGDSRAAREGLDHLQVDQDPSPLTLHGALGTQILQASGGRWSSCPPLGEYEKDILKPEGPTAELLGYGYRSAGGSLLFPRPRHLRCRLTYRGRPEVVDLLAPREPGGAEVSSKASWPWVVRPEESQEERERQAPVDEYEGPLLVTESVLGRVLTGQAPAGAAGVWLEEEVFRSEARAGIAVDNTSGRVFEGALFTRPYRRFRPRELDPGAASGAGFVAWLSTLAPVPPAKDAVGFLGGDRRRARITFEEMPEAVTEAVAGETIGERCEVLGDLCSRVTEAAREDPGEGFFLYLLTPAIEEGEPWVVESQKPLAAARGRSVRASGWEVKKRAPRPMLTLVPSGSVVFYRWPDGLDAGARAELVRRWWLRAVGPRGAAAGFGRVLPGVWR